MQGLINSSKSMDLRRKLDVWETWVAQQMFRIVRAGTSTDPPNTNSDDTGAMIRDTEGICGSYRRYFLSVLQATEVPPFDSNTETSQCRALLTMFGPQCPTQHP